MKIIPKATYRRATWKNGLGYTDEIAIYPEGSDLRAGNFSWRLSSARIEQASPFSIFPEHDRILVILRGEGLRLNHDFEGNHESVELPPLEPYEFPGDVPSTCSLLGGGVTDFSVFLRKGEVEGAAETVQIEGDFDWTPQGHWNFALATSGRFEIKGGLKLPEGDTLRVDLKRPLEEPVRFRGDGGLILVSLSVVRA
jgi:environmental stress-induced protein Ves